MWLLKSGAEVNPVEVESRLEALGAELPALQSEVLAGSLVHRGARLPPGRLPSDGYGILEDISRANVASFGKGQLGKRSGNPLIEDLIGALRIQIVHNTRNPDSAVPPLLLSSRRIESLGFATQTLNAKPFNRCFLRTDDHVFFLVHLSFIDDAPIEKHLVYGDPVLLDSDYAEEYAVISPDIMYPEDFLHWYILSGLDTSRWARGQSHVAHTLDWASPPEEWIQAQTRLAQFDFTLGDFRLLLHHAIRMTLEKRDDADIERLAAALKAGSQPDINAFMVQVAFAAGLPASFEARVPVAVPGSALRLKEKR